MKHMQLIEISERAVWDEYVRGHAFGHPLQLWGWGEIKAANGWSAHRLATVGRDSWSGGAQVLLWKIPKTNRVIAYVPRGPVVDPTSSAARMLLEELGTWARERNALYLRIEPAWQSASLPSGWRPARSHIQMAETYTIDLSIDRDELFGRMGRKHRQYTRQAERNGVTVRQGAAGDLEAVYAIYEQTAERAGFGLHAKAYYERVMSQLGESSQLLIADAEAKPVAFLWLATTDSTAYELYGGMNSTAAELHANYFLKWQAICRMQDRNVATYDFNGRVSDGVSTFKAGFGPDVTDYMGTYDLPISWIGYQTWERLWPVAKPLGRRIVRAVRGARR